MGLGAGHRLARSGARAARCLRHDRRRAAEPLLPFTIFRSRSLSVANAGMILFAAGIYAMMFFLSLYLQQVLGYSPLQAGLAYIPLAMGLVFGPVGGRLLTVIGHRATMLLGLALATAGMAWFTRISADGSFLVNVLGPSLLIAAGGQFTVVGMTTSALGGGHGGRARHRQRRLQHLARDRWRIRGRRARGAGRRPDRPARRERGVASRSPQRRPPGRSDRNRHLRSRGPTGRRGAAATRAPSVDYSPAARTLAAQSD